LRTRRDKSDGEKTERDQVTNDVGVTLETFLCICVN